MNFKYSETSSGWVIKSGFEPVGGRYDTKESAVLALNLLTRGEMDQLWMGICGHLEPGFDDSVVISANDIQNFIQEREAISPDNL
ncbi:hypothetical protein [Shimwellia blattae]|uniref:Uncharacterized protein n=1 Tax=Shimwellia blattae (strain ATCC 29907 / DSM 4481 / JCM 1650 / NBRC 105725 / CDC 9005-74) TaxID=630626 RepID=I2BBY8_SHIBC|nr:hypothetical protein [Shimwellia blattae]AFJ48042.1 hypothetical protein EBL_c29720 [Shimwellia blattae DSM 4481 = NBRC 105725]GAB81970.1 hypothetical protein EB105725_18_00990 [Shimwellia blattae DSM 4481 = NBRC 105725]VDY65541.1 Uncharacterised protein [Shimwellia blattae]VEC24893.1 Uncharacterised protein [Shimwellia blattae]